MKRILTSKSVWLSALFMILTLLIVVSVYVGKVSDLFKEIDMNDLPNFTYEDGLMESEDWEIDNGKVSLIVRTEMSTKEFFETNLNDKDLNVVFLADYISINTRNNTELLAYDYKELFGDKDITEKEVSNWLENELGNYFKELHTILVLSFILFGIVVMEFIALFTMIFAKILLVIRRKKIKMSDVYISTHDTYLFTIPVLFVGLLFGWEEIDFLFIFITILLTLVKSNVFSWLEDKIKKELEKDKD